MYVESSVRRIVKWNHNLGRYHQPCPLATSGEKFRSVDMLLNMPRDVEDRSEVEGSTMLGMSGRDDGPEECSSEREREGVLGGKSCREPKRLRLLDSVSGTKYFSCRSAGESMGSMSTFSGGSSRTVGWLGLIDTSRWLGSISDGAAPLYGDITPLAGIREALSSVPFTALDSKLVWRLRGATRRLSRFVNRV